MNTKRSRSLAGDCMHSNFSDFLLTKRRNKRMISRRILLLILIYGFVGTVNIPLYGEDNVAILHPGYVLGTVSINGYQITEAMTENDWQLFKVRPNNSPARRIAAMSYLVLRYREKGIRQQLVDTVRTAPQNKPHQWLEKALQVTTSGYWASHHGAGLPSRLAIPTLLGSRRAAETVVNILLPFTFAWGRLNP